MKDVKSNYQIFSSKVGIKNLILDCEGWEELDEDWLTDLINFKVSTIDCFEVLEEWFLIRGGKKLWIYDECSGSCIKEGNNLKGFCID